MTANAAMRGLYARLGSVNIEQAFAKKVLPEWWDNKIAVQPAGLQQAQLFFSRAFNIDIRSWSEASESLRFRSVVHKYKRNQGKSEAKVIVSAHYANAMARLALQATPVEFSAVNENPVELREYLLRHHDCINLNVLLSYCAEIGVPVLYIEKMPDVKMDGLAIRFEDRYAIVLSKKGHPSELLFHLAHELGHIAKNHLGSQDGFLVDQKISASDGGDADEKEADAYAIRLLNGLDAEYRAEGFLSESALYSAACECAARERVDVGHIILNYGHHNNRHALAKLALKRVEPDYGGPLVNEALFNLLDLELLSEDQAHLLKIATEYSAE
ncbi:MAG: ImmA/IrrE family metallo-endopeptidase [Pseudomonadota bacterium]